MSMRHDEKIDPTRAGTLLQNLGYSIAGTSLTARLSGKPAMAAPLGFSATHELMFDAQLQDQNQNPVTVLGSASYAQGMMFFRTSTTDGSGSTFNDIQFLDVQNQQFAFSLLSQFGSDGLPSTPFITPVSDGKVVYTASGNIVYSIDVNGQTMQGWGPPLPSVIVSPLLLVNGKLLFVTADGRLYAYDTSAQQSVWNYSTEASISSTSLTLSGSNLFIIAPGLFAVVDITTGSQIWKNPNGSVPVGPAAAIAGQIFISGSDNFLKAYDAASSKLEWAYPADSPSPYPVQTTAESCAKHLKSVVASQQTVHLLISEIQ